MAGRLQTMREMELVAHLLRRASFGAPYDELEAYAAKGYEATVEELLYPERQADVDEHMMLRTEPSWQDLGDPMSNQTHWMYRMINSGRPLEEKIALFWHGVLCTAYSKVDSYRQMTVTIERFRHNGLGSFEDILTQLASDPGMIYYLDNCMSHKGAVNENWGRELLELFSMGVGNYSEDDVKEASRAFTGWTNAPTTPSYPYVKAEWRFLYDATDHDDGSKVFLGHRGRLNGEDVVKLICQQPSTARFVSRHLYNFFVADEGPVPQWANSPPTDPEAIDLLCQAYFDHHYEIRSVLRVLFNSQFFKAARFSKVKSPVEMVVETIRLAKSFNTLKPGLSSLARQCQYMGQEPMNPPTVEGWHTGPEWIDSGTLLERVNFVAGHLGDQSHRGVLEILTRLRSRGTSINGEELLNGCLEQLGFVTLQEDTRRALVSQAGGGREVLTDTDEFAQRATRLLQSIVCAKEYQFG